MHHRPLGRALVAGLVLPLALAGASLAQDAAPPPSGAAAHHWDPAQMRARMAEHLRAALQLQPSQDAALNTFVDAMRPPGGMRDRQGADRGDDRDQLQHMMTPERLDRMTQRMDAQRARMTARIAATRQFYAQLSPSQQKAFDAMPMMMDRHGGHGMGGPDGAGMKRPGGGRGGWDRGDDGMGPGGPPRG